MTMIGFTEGFLAWLASTAIPAFVGLLVIVWAGNVVKPKYLTAFALGIFLWFFVDTIQGSANLDVNAGFTGGVAQVAAVGLFIIGVLVRSEEHTSELQSLTNLVCRLLLEKKKKNKKKKILIKSQ